MIVIRIVAVAMVAVVCLGSSTAASRPGGSKPDDWRTYRLLDGRNSRGPVALIESRHHRTGPFTVAMRTHLLLRSGAHWFDATPRGPKWFIEDAYFLDRRHGWLVAHDCAAGKGAMYRTRDGGRSWRQLPWGFTHGCAAGSGFRLTFLDKRHGWVMSPAPTAPSGGIIRTQDGGKSWTYSYTSPTGIPVLDEAVFTTPRKGWAIGLSWLRAEPLYKTSDAGRTWEPDPGLPRARYSVPVFFGRKGIVMGRRRGAATFFRTTDAGRNWSAVYRLDVRGLRFPDFRAPTERNWWVFGMKGSTPIVEVTEDAGRAWRRVVVPAAGYSIDLSAAPGQRAWLTTTPLIGKGIVLSTTDSGRTWSRFAPRYKLDPRLRK